MQSVFACMLISLDYGFLFLFLEGRKLSLWAGLRNLLKGAIKITWSHHQNDDQIPVSPMGLQWTLNARFCIFVLFCFLNVET